MMSTGACLPNTQIELIREPSGRGRYRAVLFDFDGTLSLIREGWPQVMIPMMVDVLAEAPGAEPRDEIRRVVEEYVMRLTGKQTIYQMIELADQVGRRGGAPLDPLEYKRRYYRLLMERIRGRREGLLSGRIQPEEMLVPGSTDILSALRGRGLTLYCASGTDEAHVREEAEMLGIAGFFNGGVHGALDDYQRFSKALLIRRLLHENDLHGPELLAFGDGFVEIENTRNVGGTAVGVASDEAGRRGVDEWKRRRLLRAGADLIIPDFRETAALVAYLFPEDA